MPVDRGHLVLELKQDQQIRIGDAVVWMTPVKNAGGDGWQFKVNIDAPRTTAITREPREKLAS